MAYKDTIHVEATEQFKDRRLDTIEHLTKKQFRSLQAGQTVEILKKAFEAEQSLYKEVKHGNRIL